MNDPQIGIIIIPSPKGISWGRNRMGHKLMGNLRQTIEAVGVFGGGRKKLSPIHTPSSSFLIADELSDYVEGTVHY